MVAFAWLTGESSVLVLFPRVTTANCFYILHLYNLLVAAANIWKWIMALISSCRTRNYGHEWNSDQQHSFVGWDRLIDPVVLSTVPLFLRPRERRVIFSCNLVPSVYSLKIVLTLILRTAWSIPLIFWELWELY